LDIDEIQINVDRISPLPKPRLSGNHREFQRFEMRRRQRNVHAAITKYTSSFEQQLRTVKAHSLTDYVTTSGPALVQQLYGALPPICKQLKARRNPGLEFPDLRSNYDELKHEIMCVLKWPDAKSEFAKFEQDSMSQRKIHAGVTIDPSQHGRDFGGKEKSEVPTIII